jgi:hypothetical protein
MHPSLSVLSRRLRLKSDHSNTQEPLLIRLVSPLICIDELFYQPLVEIWPAVCEDRDAGSS